MDFQKKFNGICLCQSFPHLLGPRGSVKCYLKILDAWSQIGITTAVLSICEWLFLIVQSPTHANVIIMERIQPWHSKRMFPTLGILKGSCKGMLQQLLCCQHSADISLEGSALAESLLKDVSQHLSGEKCPCTILAKRSCSLCNTVHLYHFQFH
jgi:hypothetical protein